MCDNDARRWGLRAPKGETWVSLHAPAIDSLIGLLMAEGSSVIKMLKAAIRSGPDSRVASLPPVRIHLKWMCIGGTDLASTLAPVGRWARRQNSAGVALGTGAKCPSKSSGIFSVNLRCRVFRVIPTGVHTAKCHHSAFTAEEFRSISLPCMKSGRFVNGRSHSKRDPQRPMRSIITHLEHP
jgi:hypothetical protein